MRVLPDGDAIPGQVLRAFLHAVERSGFDAQTLVSKVPVEQRALVSVVATVPWNQLAAMVDAFAAEHGQAALNRVAREMVLSLPGLWLLAGFMLPSHLFYRALAEVGGRARFWTVGYDDSGPAAVVDLQLKESLPGCAPLFAALGEMLAASATLLHLPEAEVACSTHDHGGRFEVKVTNGHAAPPWLTEAQLAALLDELRQAGSWSTNERPASGSGLPTVAQLEQRFGLTRAESRVVRRLVAGRSLREIAKALGVGSETVRTHAKRAMQKTNTHRQAELVALVLRSGHFGPADQQEE